MNDTINLETFQSVGIEFNEISKYHETWPCQNLLGSCHHLVPSQRWKKHSLWYQAPKASYQWKNDIIHWKKLSACY
jgi:hypothetical protein